MRKPEEDDVMSMLMEKGGLKLLFVSEIIDS